MGIIKVSASRSTDADPPSALLQPADLFHRSVAHADHRKIAPFIVVGHHIRPLMVPFSAIGALRSPGIIIMHIGALSVRVLRNRKVFQILQHRFISIAQLFKFHRLHRRQAFIIFLISGKGHIQVCPLQWISVCNHIYGQDIVWVQTFLSGELPKLGNRRPKG